MIKIFLGVTAVIFCYSDGVTDVVKSNGKKLSVSTGNSVGIKVVKRNSSDGTIHRKTNGRISIEKLNGRFICHLYWTLVSQLVETYLIDVKCLLVFRIDLFCFWFVIPIFSDK
jgi:hypothetical protein